MRVSPTGAAPSAGSRYAVPGKNFLGTPVVPFCPFYLGFSLLKLNSGKKGTLVLKGLLGNLVSEFRQNPGVWGEF